MFGGRHGSRKDDPGAGDAGGAAAPKGAPFDRGGAEVAGLELGGGGRPVRAASATALRKALAGVDVLVTTYGVLRKDAAILREIEADYVILDEAQAIKNVDSESTKAARLLRGDHRLALSGTPIENHLGELWSLIEFLNPGMLGA